MGAYLYWQDKLGVPKILYFDLVTQEQHHLKTEATSFPVEEGVDITDHVRPEVDRVSLQTFVSNTPIIEVIETSGKVKHTGKLLGVQVATLQSRTLDVKAYEPPLAPTPGSVLNALTSAIGNLLTGRKEYKASVLAFTKEFDNIQEVYDTLRKIRTDSQRVSVVTSTRTYANMILEDINMTRSADTGTGATFSVDCKEIRIVSALKVLAPRAAASSGFPRKNNGAKGPTDVDDPTKRYSIAAKGLNALGNFGGTGPIIP